MKKHYLCIKFYSSKLYYYEKNQFPTEKRNFTQ